MARLRGACYKTRVADSCLFFAEAGAAFSEPAFAARLSTLLEWFGPLTGTLPPVSESRTPFLRAGAISFGAPVQLASRSTVWWLERAPHSLSDAAALLEAPDAVLRDTSTGLLVALSDRRCRLVTGPCGPTSLYAARGAQGVVYATHAVAAAILARGDAHVDASVLAELLAFGTVGSSNSLVRGTSVVPAATCVEWSPAGVESRSYWPLAERWGCVPSEEAQRHTSEALLRVTARRLRPLARPWLGLTSGLDSRVVAAAAGECGFPLRTFTWGAVSGDEAGGAAVAQSLGFPHEVLEPAACDEAEGMAHIRREVRFNEGLGRMNAFGDVPWPVPMDTFVTGGGGEVGRAFWWSGVGRNFVAPTPAQAARALGVGPMLRGAGEDTVARVAADIRGGAGEAHRSGRHRVEAPRCAVRRAAGRPLGSRRAQLARTLDRRGVL